MTVGPEVAMLTDLIESHSVISSFNQRVTGPQWYEPSSLPLDVFDWSTISHV